MARKKRRFQLLDERIYRVDRMIELMAVQAMSVVARPDPSEVVWHDRPGHGLLGTATEPVGPLHVR